MKKHDETQRSASRFIKYLICIIVAGVVGLVIACAQFFGTQKAERYSVAVLEFTYDGAAQNLTPSGEKFSIDAITGDTVLQKALEKAGVSDKYTVEALRNSIVVTGSYPKDVIDRIEDYTSLYDFSSGRQVSLNDYYPTIYSISLYDGFDKKATEETMNKIVRSVAESYKEFFLKEYVYSFDMSKYDSLLNIEDYDYLQRIKILNQRLRMIEKFAVDMYAEDTNFKYNGWSFNDINLKCKDISNDSLKKLEAMVTMNAFTISNSRLQNQYKYEIQLLENELAYKQMNLEELNELIENYQTDDIVYIGSGDSLVKVDNNSKKTYEELIGMKREISDRIVEINTEIKDYKLHLNDLTAASISEAQDVSAADDQIDKISTLIDSIEERFEELIIAYNSSIVSEDAISVEDARYYSSNLLSSAFIVKAVKCAGPLCIIVMIICSIHSAVCEIKNYRKKAA